LAKRLKSKYVTPICHKSPELISLLEVATNLIYSADSPHTAQPKDKAKARYSTKIKKLSNIHKNLSIMLLKRQEMLFTYRQKVLFCTLNEMEAQNTSSNIDLFHGFLTYTSNTSVL